MGLISQIHSKYIFQSRVRRISSKISTYLNGSDRVLDIGCGDGQISTQIQDLVQGLTIKGVDTFVRENAVRDIDVYDGVQLPYSDNAFDCTLLIDVLHHTESPESVLKEAVRVTKGNVLIKDHLLSNRVSFFFLSFMDWIGNNRFGVKSPNNYLKENEWNHLFSQLNLELID